MIAPPKPPSHDELEALIKEARERQLRRRLLGAAGIAIAAALGLAVYAATIGDGGHVKLTGGSATSSPPLCRASQLSASAGLNGATGTMAGVAELTNTGGTTCSLPRTAPLVGIFLGSRLLPVRQKPLRDSSETHAHELAPGAAAFVHMDWSNWCGKPREGALIRPVLRLRFPGLQVAARAHEMTLPRCGSPGGSTLYVSPALTG
jgi:Domain of unknown function (DUF4232)